MSRMSSRHVDRRALLKGTTDWECCCRHGASDDFQRAVRLLQPYLPQRRFAASSCFLRPSIMQIRTTSCPKEEEDADTVRVWLGAGGAALFKLQVHSKFGSKISFNSTEEPVSEMNVQTDATIRLRGMANYGVASSLGQMLDSNPQLKLQQQQPHLHPHPFKQPQLQIESVTRSGNVIRSLSHGLARVRTSSPGPIKAARSTTTAVPLGHPMSTAATARLARSACTLPGKAVRCWTGGRASVGRKNVAVPRHGSDWLDVLLRASDLIDGSGNEMRAATVSDFAYDDDLLRPDTGPTASASNSEQAAVPDPAVTVTAWLRQRSNSSLQDQAPGGCCVGKQMTSTALAVDDWGKGEFEGLHTTAAAVVADLAVDEGDDDDVFSDVSKQALSMRWQPGGAAERCNVHLLNLLDLPQEAGSLRIPFPRSGSGSEWGAEGGATMADREEQVWVLDLLDGRAEEDNSVCVPACSSGYQFLPAATAVSAVAAEGTCSLMDASEEVDVPASTLAATGDGPSLVQAALLDDQRLVVRREAVAPPTAVEVLNLLEDVAAPPSGGARQYIGDCIVSYIDTLCWYDEEERMLGECHSGAEPNGGYPSGAMFAFMFSEDEGLVPELEADFEECVSC